MRKFLLISPILFLLANGIQAQASKDVTAEITVSANVIQSIELITVNTIQLGKMQPGQKEVNVNPVNDLNAGYMIAIGTPEAEFRLNYLSERELVQTDGNGSIIFSYKISGGVTENQASSELLEYDNRNISFNSEGRFYIWVGGKINLENAAPGTYEGDFTIEIDYI